MRAAAAYVSRFAGGHGAVRDILEFILKAQGKWQGLVRGFQAKTSMDGLAQ